MTQPLYLLNEVAKLVKRKPYQVSYLISIGAIPEPKLRINNKRVFTPEEVVQVQSVIEERAARAGGKPPERRSP